MWSVWLKIRKGVTELAQQQAWNTFLSKYDRMSQSERGRAVAEMSPEQRSYLQTALGERDTSLEHLKVVAGANERKGRRVIFLFAVLCGFIGVIPLSSVILIPTEIFMIYRLSRAHELPFRVAEFGVSALLLYGVSRLLVMFVGGILIAIPGPGWVAKAIIAFCFVVALGSVANKYYSNRFMSLRTQKGVRAKGSSLATPAGLGEHGALVEKRISEIFAQNVLKRKDSVEEVLESARSTWWCESQPDFSEGFFGGVGETLVDLYRESVLKRYPRHSVAQLGKAFEDMTGVISMGGNGGGPDFGLAERLLRDNVRRLSNFPAMASHGLKNRDWLAFSYFGLAVIASYGKKDGEVARSVLNCFFFSPRISREDLLEPVYKEFFEAGCEDIDDLWDQETDQIQEKDYTAEAIARKVLGGAMKGAAFVHNQKVDDPAAKIRVPPVEWLGRDKSEIKSEAWEKADAKYERMLDQRCQVLAEHLLKG